MFASIHYIQTRHQPADIPNQPTHSLDTNAAETNPLDPSTQDAPTKPDDPETFKSALRELARDLVLKEQQIEYLISVLPGIGESEANQSQRIVALEKELREADEERKAAVKVKDELVHTLGVLAAECKRVY